MRRLEQHFVAFSYTEIPSSYGHLSYDKVGLIDADNKAFNSFWKTWPVEKEKLETRLQKLYGKRFLFLTLTTPTRGTVESKPDYYTLNFTKNTLRGYCPKTVGFYYQANPILYFLRQK